MSDYDSGDDLFDGVDEAALLSSPPPRRAGHSACDEDRGPNKRRRLAASAPDCSAGPGAGQELARRILRDKFGFVSFRHEQEQAINSVLAGKNTLAIFPTGAGKSLCYQIPAVAFEELDRQDGPRGEGEHGITIVVSPLIALMRDQVEALRRRGIRAECIDSTKTWEEQQATTAALRRGELRLVYCAPERLNNEGFVETMKHVAGGVRLVAVDEAHCISEWGHSFRPEYLKVARFVEEIAAERVICLTATATPKVAGDVCKAFGIDDAAVFRTSPYRPNLQLLARAVGSKKDKNPLLFDFLGRHPGPSLVYVTLQQQSVALAAALRKQGFDADAYHAGLKPEEKKRVQDEFMGGGITIVVATIAFGMGIDKADIRNIVHYDSASSVEEYSQQIGRAGRDGKPSTCMYLLCPEDDWMRENFARGDLPSASSVRGLLEDVFDADVAALPVGGTFKRSHYRQSRDLDIRASPLSIIYAALELRFGLLRAVTPEYSEYKFAATPRYYAQMKTDASPAGAAIFRHARKAVRWHQLDPSAVAAAAGVRRADIVRRLNELHDQGVVELRAGGVEPRYRLLAPAPAPADLAPLAAALHADCEARERDALRRAAELARLVAGDGCLARALAEHFGMGLPAAAERCGHCGWCADGRAVARPAAPPRVLDAEGVRRVLAECDVRDDPRFLARVAFGIKSPRVTQLKLDRKPVFGSLADHDFELLMKEFAKACGQK